MLTSGQCASWVLASATYHFAGNYDTNLYPALHQVVLYVRDVEVAEQDLQFHPFHEELHIGLEWKAIALAFGSH
jgi:hypothetical protein